MPLAWQKVPSIWRQALGIDKGWFFLQRSPLPIEERRCKQRNNKVFWLIVLVVYVICISWCGGAEIKLFELLSDRVNLFNKVKYWARRDDASGSFFMGSVFYGKKNIAGILQDKIKCEKSWLFDISFLYASRNQVSFLEKVRWFLWESNMISHRKWLDFSWYWFSALYATK